MFRNYSQKLPHSQLNDDCQIQLNNKKLENQKNDVGGRKQMDSFLDSKSFLKL